MSRSSLDAVCAARELLASLTPLTTDCGRLCAGACCQGDASTGMLLFPDEEKLYGQEAPCTFAKVLPTDFMLGGSSAQLFVCQGTCPREARPLACRLFPLFLTFKPDGSTRLRLDTRAKAVCPLTDYGIRALDPAFRHATRQAYDILLADPHCAAYLRDLDEAFTL